MPSLFPGSPGLQGRGVTTACPALTLGCHVAPGTSVIAPVAILTGDHEGKTVTPLRKARIPLLRGAEVKSAYTLRERLH